MPPIYDLHGGDHPNFEDIPLPNSNWLVFERPASRPYGLVGVTKWRWKKDKPLYFGEGLYWMLDNDKSTASRFIGEDVFEDTKLGDVNWHMLQNRRNICRMGK